MPRTKNQERERQEPRKEKKIAKAPKNSVHASGQNSEKEQFLGDDPKNQGLVQQADQPQLEKSQVIKRQQQGIDKSKNSENQNSDSPLDKEQNEFEFEQSGDSQEEQEDCYRRSDASKKGLKKRKTQKKQKASEQAQEQSQKDPQQNLNSEQSSPVTPAVQGMKFRKVRGTKMQDLIDGKVKINQSGLVDKQVNDYLGIKKKVNPDQQKKPNKATKKKKPVSDSQQSVYNFNQVDSDDQESYIQSSSGRDQFDSDFDLTQSYPGKRGRKKGSKSKKRGKGRGRPRTSTVKPVSSAQQKSPGKKRGRPRKIIYDENGNQISTPIPPRPLIRKEDRGQNQGVRKRGRPRKYQISAQNKESHQLKENHSSQNIQKAENQFQHNVDKKFAKFQGKQGMIRQEKNENEYQYFQRQFSVRQEDRQLGNLNNQRKDNYRAAMDNQFVNNIMGSQPNQPQQRFQ